MTHTITSKHFRPIQHFVLVRPEDETKRGDIEIPDGYREDQHGFENVLDRNARSCVGTVVAKGRGATDPNYKYDVDEVEIGDRVVYERTAAVRAELEDGLFVVVGVGGIWMVLDATTEVVAHVGAFFRLHVGLMASANKQQLALRRAAELATPGDLDSIHNLISSWLALQRDTTVKTYYADLKDFAEWAGASDVDSALAALFSHEIHEANAIVLAYKASMAKRPVYRSRYAKQNGQKPVRRGLAAATINRRLTALRSVARVARLVGQFDGEIEVKGVPSQSYKDTAGLGDEAYRKVIAELERKTGEPGFKGRKALRDLTMIRLLHDAALRRNEVRNLDVEHVDLEQRKLRLIKPKHRDGDVVLKLGDTLHRVLQRWLESCEANEGPLFLSRKRGRMHPSTINRLVTDATEAVGVRGVPHGMRHTAITTALDRGASLRDVARFARHKDVRVTMIYDDRRNEPTPEIQDLIGE